MNQANTLGRPVLHGMRWRNEGVGVSSTFPPDVLVLLPSGPLCDPLRELNKLYRKHTRVRDEIDSFKERLANQ